MLYDSCCQCLIKKFSLAGLQSNFGEWNSKYCLSVCLSMLRPTVWFAFQVVFLLVYMYMVSIDTLFSVNIDHDDFHWNFTFSCDHDLGLFPMSILRSYMYILCKTLGLILFLVVVVCQNLMCIWTLNTSTEIWPSLMTLTLTFLFRVLVPL